MKQVEKKSLLTKREAEILIQLAGGSLYKEIAVSSSISIETVKKHTKNIYKKLSVRNRTEAANFFTKEAKNSN
jgi:DNA-binding NarL/FixJ family response regulator